MSAETRGHAIKKEMETLGIARGRLAGMARVSEKTVTRAVRGEASDKTLTAIEEALAKERLRVGPELPESPATVPVPDESRDRVVFRLTGIYGAQEVVVEGPADKLVEIEAAVEKILRGNTIGNEDRAE